MNANTLKLYHSAASPNSRRVRIFLAEKGLKVPLVAVDATRIHRPVGFRMLAQRAAREDFFADLNERLGKVPSPASAIRRQTLPPWSPWTSPRRSICLCLRITLR
jgi:hypothetical protein